MKPWRFRFQTICLNLLFTKRKQTLPLLLANFAADLGDHPADIQPDSRSITAQNIFYQNLRCWDGSVSYVLGEFSSSWIQIRYWGEIYLFTFHLVWSDLIWIIKYSPAEWRHLNRTEGPCWTWRCHLYYHAHHTQVVSCTQSKHFERYQAEEQYLPHSFLCTHINHLQRAETNQTLKPLHC